MKSEEEKKVKVSVIIPVYNCEAYLEKCIGSVLNQTLYETEIICIDDGSTDQSAKVLEKFAAAEPRITLLRQQNEGAGKARNAGLRAAAGKYVAFLDADDYYVDRDALEKMYDTCEKTNISVCGSRRLELDGEKEKKGALFADMFADGQKTVICSYQDYQIDYDYQNFLFERALLWKNGITFPPYRRFQDPPFLVKALFAAKQFAVANTCLYGYRLPDIVFRFNAGKTADLIKGLSDNLEFAKEKKLEILFEKTLERLEYEYANLICHNMSEENTELLRLLWKANEIVCEKKQEPDYMIRPLRMLFYHAKQGVEQYEEDLAEVVRQQKTVAVYGAGKLAKKLLHFLEEKQLRDKVSCMIVSDQRGNADHIDQVPVILADHYEEREELVLAALGAINHGSVKKVLELRGIEQYILVDDVFLNRL